MKIRMIEDPRPRLATHHNPASQWMWCRECERFFQYGHVLAPAGGVLELCPFQDCAGLGVGFDLLLWDATREPADARWPRSEAELAHGLKSPEMAPFHAGQNRARIAQMAEAFRQSDEARALGCAEAGRHAESFLNTMAMMDWDLTDEPMEPAPHDPIQMLGLWTACSGTRDPGEVPPMLDELYALLGFAHRTQAIPGARLWLEGLANREEAEAWMVKHLVRPPAPAPGSGRARKRAKRPKRGRRGRKR